MSTTGNWLKGCGIGCLVLIVLNVIIIFSGVRLLKNTFSEFEDVADLQEQITDLYGEMDDYVPNPDGAVSASRMEAFLAVQNAIYPESEGIGSSVESFRDLKNSESGGLGKVVSIVRNAKSIGQGVGRVLRARNTALLEQRMGMGEYTYIYVIAYHSWLGHALLDIPGENDDGDMTTSERLHENIVDILKSQRDALKRSVDPDPDLLERLEAEILELRIDDERVPWQDGLPDVVVASLEPYRARLEELHVPISFLLGIGAENDHGGFDFQFN